MKWLITVIVLDLAIVAWVLSDAREVDRADFVFVGGSAHRFLDPQRMSWLHDIRIAECLFEPLTRVKLPEMSIEPGAAERWRVDDDALTYTFHLRPSATWSNGDPVTATDFIFAWRRALLPDLAADYSQMLWVIEGAEQFFQWRQAQLQAYAKNPADQTRAVAERMLDEALQRFDTTVALRAPDEKTLVVKLARPVPYFLQLCAFATYMPVHRATVEKTVSINVDTGQLVQDPYWTRPDRLICNGPYVLARRRFKRDLLMLANKYYWNRKAMGNRSILERIIANPSNATLLYEAGQVDWLPDVPSATSLAAGLAAAGRDDVHLVAAAGTYFYNFNCQPTLSGGAVNPLADSRVRVALSMAIDRHAIVENITRLRQPPARTFVPQGALPDYAPPTDAAAPFDPPQARAMLESAGYGPPNLKRLDGLSILYNTGFGHERIAQAIKRMWQEHLGVSVTLEGREVTVFGDRLRNHNFTIARAGWFGDYLDPTTYLDKFKTGNGNNDAAYSNPEFDQLMRRAASELDVRTRMSLLAEAETLMLQEQPIVPIYQYVNLHVFDPQRVKFMHPNAWNFRRLEFVEVAP